MPQQSITFMYSALLCIYTFLTSFCISRFEITVNLHYYKKNNFQEDNTAFTDQIVQRTKNPFFSGSLSSITNFDFPV